MIRLLLDMTGVNNGITHTGTLWYNFFSGFGGVIIGSGFFLLIARWLQKHPITIHHHHHYVKENNKE